MRWKIRCKFSLCPLVNVEGEGKEWGGVGWSEFVGLGLMMMGDRTKFAIKAPPGEVERFWETFERAAGVVVGILGEV